MLCPMSYKLIMWKLTEIKTSVTCHGYVMAYLPEHPNSHHGSIFFHRLVMEEHLGRLLLPREEVVHHKDGDKRNNDLSNLELTTASAHARYHRLQNPRPKTVFSLTCPQCGQEFERRAGIAKRNKRDFCSLSCAGKFYPKLKPLAPHGDYKRYRRGCRCAECKTANTERMKKYRGS
jgi:hypothetical protein